jgi:hypothetical protein
MDEMTLGKEFGIMRYQKAQAENYNPEIVAECDTEAEALELIDSDMYQGNAVEGFDVVCRDAAGIIYYYSGDVVDMRYYD